MRAWKTKSRRVLRLEAERRQLKEDLFVHRYSVKLGAIVSPPIGAWPIGNLNAIFGAAKDKSPLELKYEEMERYFKKISEELMKFRRVNKEDRLRMISFKYRINY